MIHELEIFQSNTITSESMTKFQMLKLSNQSSVNLYYILVAVSFRIFPDTSNSKSKGKVF